MGTLFMVNVPRDCNESELSDLIQSIGNRGSSPRLRTSNSTNEMLHR
jgi:hypothetical protein